MQVITENKIDDEIKINKDDSLNKQIIKLEVTTANTTLK